MMVALRAFNADTQERLRYRAGHFARPGDRFVEVAGWGISERTLGGDELTHKLVVRLVLAQAVSNPTVVFVGSFVAQGLPIDTKQIGPLERPIVGEFRTL